MKAILANFSLGREVWGRVRAKILRREDASYALSLQLAEVPEPTLVAAQWVRVRTIMSGISGMDEALILHHDPAPLGAFLSFPFVPGNENLGIVTEVGEDVHGIEPGERVIVDPVLSCRPRQVQPPCPSCSRGDPSSCRNFAKGVVGPGTMIGACRDTSGGWADSFIAHQSQVRQLPRNMESDQAVLVPEFARAVRAILQHPPAAGDRVIVMGAGSLGILTLVALQMLGYRANILVVADHPFEVDVVRKLSEAEVVLASNPGTAYEEVAAFVKGTVHYPEAGRITLEGGADLVYETTGLRDRVGDALRFTGEGKKVVLMGITEQSGFDITPLWFKSVRICGTLFSGRDSHKGEMRETFDIAMDLAAGDGLPVSELVTHRFKLEEYESAFAILADRAGTRAIKVLFQHVV
ncbi:MAG: zinc-dependent alcohol dehydrogenase [Desulfomonilaceae bacterium]